MINEHTVALQEIRIIPRKKGMVVWIPKGEPLPWEINNPVPNETILKWVDSLKDADAQKVESNEETPSRNATIIAMKQTWFGTIDETYISVHYNESHLHL